MKIALLGYGKMGQVIERIAKERGHEIVLKKTRTTLMKDYQPQMYIDFSVPSSSVQYLQLFSC
jgi:4-hydroxy-tetrahydrodipicolinate reductase